MATAQQNVYTNTSFSAEQTNSEEEFAEYDEITYEQTKKQTNDGNTTISNIPLPRQADMQSRSKIQVTLWLLFAIIAFFLAIVITGVVTFFITKERFIGKQCNQCENQPCFNGGLCKSIGDNFTCTCRPGFSGLRCGERPCDSSPCLNGGICNITDSAYSCTCVRGFSGGQCQISACDSNPCQNEGTCKVAGDSYICGCLSGYFGRQCEDKYSCDNSGIHLVSLSNL